MITKDLPINKSLLCSTYKNKLEKIQCPNKRKKNLLFCGKHKNETNIIEFNHTINNHTINNDTINNKIVQNENNTVNTINTILNNDVLTKIDLPISISKRKILKSVEKNKYYYDYLNIRKMYIKEKSFI